ncbi:hypothetical protein AAFF_G00073270 [Aldrovandia affinis]|uniref:Uncharacterized protein n=1 Tax=Aldrovandia affinis TaxID=143900 RepID=A0AAD7WDF0_9TELE|nr:hypothetical protein AAFF_G00073270 [Aldrovandia affinis]
MSVALCTAGNLDLKALALQTRLCFPDLITATGTGGNGASDRDRLKPPLQNANDLSHDVRWIPSLRVKWTADWREGLSSRPPAPWALSPELEERAGYADCSSPREPQVAPERAAEQEAL